MPQIEYITYATAVGFLSRGDTAIRNFLTGERYTDGDDLTEWDNQLPFWIEAASTELAAGGAGGTVTQGPGNDGGSPWTVQGPTAAGDVIDPVKPVIAGFVGDLGVAQAASTAAPLPTVTTASDILLALIDGRITATNTILGTAADDAWSGSGDATVIALLKAIALNTTPTP